MCKFGMLSFDLSFAVRYRNQSELLELVLLLEMILVDVAIEIVVDNFFVWDVLSVSELRYFLAPQQITSYNGSALVAMLGKNCFAIASDRRLGVNFQTIATDYQRIFEIHEKLYIGLSGLGTDVQTL